MRKVIPTCFILWNSEIIKMLCKNWGVMVFQGGVEIELGKCFEESSSICVSFSFDASCSFPSDIRADKL